MKILHIIDTLARGGAERLLVMVLPELVRQGHQVAVAVRGGPYDLQPELEKAGVPVIHLPKRYRWNLVAGARDISRAMPEADILHAHLYFPTVYTGLSRLLGFTQARTCATFHNLAYAGANKDGIKLQLRKKLARAIYPRGIQAKLAVSQAVADHYRQNLYLDNVDVIYNPIDLAVIDAIKTVPRAPDAPLHVVLPGRLVPEKGHTDLIAALNDPRLEGQSLEVTFVGHGVMHTELKGIAESTPFPLVITGDLDHKSFLTVMGTADIVITPSRYEGFGLTALEAMSLSKPLIASTAGGLPEVVGDTGRLVPVGDIKAIADAILDFSQDKSLREAMGKASRARSEAEFGLSTKVSQLTKAYAALMHV